MSKKFVAAYQHDSSGDVGIIGAFSTEEDAWEAIDYFTDCIPIDDERHYTFFVRQEDDQKT